MEKELLLDLRGKQSLSMSEIAKLTGEAKSSVSYFCKKHNIIPSNPKRLVSRMAATSKFASYAYVDQWAQKKAEVKKTADDEMDAVKSNPLLLVFLGLYWGEGKKYGGLRITNNDPMVIKTSHQALQIISDRPDFTLNINYYPDHDPTTLHDWWLSFINIKPILRAVNRHPSTKNRGGVKLGKAKYGQAILFHNDWRSEVKVHRWLELLKLEYNANMTLSQLPPSK